MKKVLIDYVKRGAFDELYTPVYAIKPVLSIIPWFFDTIWCPFDTPESNIVKELQANNWNGLLKGE